MKITNWERLFIITTTLILNKVFLVWMIGGNDIWVRGMAFGLFMLNFIVLAKSIDKVIEGYEKTKKGSK